MIKCKPFVKWVGGKTQLIGTIEKSLPKNFRDMKNVTYIEPFVGGGAMLFWVLRNFSNISHAVINDINPTLTCAYRVVRDEPKILIEYLSQLEREFLIMNDEERKGYFLEQRIKYNSQNLNDIERTGLFIFLNRTCFNGLYRVNKKGEFNVPYGRYTNPKICDKLTILSDSEVLQNVEILTGDFAETINYAGENSLFYFDPPYKPISKTSSFTTYTKEDFNDGDQIRLGEFCEMISLRGSQFILSNSDLLNGEEDDFFFDNLYNNFSIERVSANRMINSVSSGRGKISEILVTNINM